VSWADPSVLSLGYRLQKELDDVIAKLEKYIIMTLSKKAF
jgi:hypothetical protein